MKPSKATKQDGNDTQYGHGGFDSDVFQNLVPFSSCSYSCKLEYTLRTCKTTVVQTHSTFHAAIDKSEGILFSQWHCG